MRLIPSRSNGKTEFARKQIEEAQAKGDTFHYYDTDCLYPNMLYGITLYNRKWYIRLINYVARFLISISYRLTIRERRKQFMKDKKKFTYHDNDPTEVHQ